MPAGTAPGASSRTAPRAGHQFAWDTPTLSFICNAHEAGTLAVYPNDPRNVTARAEQYLAETGIADESCWMPDF